MRITGPFLPALLAAALSAPLLGPALPAQAETAAPAARLSDVIHVDALFAAVADEGAASGKDLDASLLGGEGGPGFAADVARAYDPARLAPAFATALGVALPAEVEAAAVAFWGSDAGQRIVLAEIEARRALIDPATREAAEVAADRMGEKRDPRLRLIRRIIEQGDMIELGVTGTMTTYLAFNDGMAETGPETLALPPEERAAEVYGQEAQIRADTTAWLISFMALAYSGLSEADLQAYADFLETPEGGRTNAALARAFETVMTPVSRAVGQAAGRALSGSTI